MPCSNSSPLINVVPPQEWADALELVFSHLGPEERRRQLSEALAGISAPEGTPAEGLLGARRAGRLVGALFAQVAPGRMAVVWLPRLVRGESKTTGKRLLAAAWDCLCRQRITLAQVVLPTVDEQDRAMLRLGGFRHLANLLYLVGPTNGVQPTVASGRDGCNGASVAQRTGTITADALEYEPYSAADHGRLERVMEATYEGTLDCPRLGHLRSAADVLAGYRSTSAFDPRHWLMVRQEGRDVGCLLMADHPRQDHMELLYLGLIPGARGSGRGRQVVGHAQRLAGLAGRERLVLAVDAANRPAVQIYTAAGFRTWGRRRLYVRAVGDADNWHASF
jgi:mycothiol synthase